MRKDMGKKIEKETSPSSKPSELEITRRRRTYVEKSTQTSPSRNTCSSCLQKEHVHSYNIPNSARFAENLSNRRTCSNACEIQVMPANCYVHKKLHYKSRREHEDRSESMPVIESASGVLSAAFKPSSDTVMFSRYVTGGIVTPVIQPPAAISTKSLIIVPCTQVPGQDLVPQNEVLHTDCPVIGLKSAIACPTIVEQPDVSNSAACKYPPRKLRQPTMNNAVDDERNLPSSSKVCTLNRKISEGVLNDEHAVGIDPDKCSLESNDSLVDQYSLPHLSLKAKKCRDVTPRQSPIRRRNSVIPTSHLHSTFHRSGGPGTSPGTSALSSVHSIPSPTNYFSTESFNISRDTVIHSISQALPVLPSAAVDNLFFSQSPLPTSGMPHNKLIKYGNFKCEGCDTVFIKYNTLMKHKNSFCTYIKQSSDVSAAAEAGEETQETLNKPQKPAYFCDVCDFKCCTLDILKSHKARHCIKKTHSVLVKATLKEGDVPSSKDRESLFSGPEEYKRNDFETTFSSHETLQSNMRTHTESTSYKCLVGGTQTHTYEDVTNDATSIYNLGSQNLISKAWEMTVIQNTLEYTDEDFAARKELEVAVASLTKDKDTNFSNEQEEE